MNLNESHTTLSRANSRASHRSRTSRNSTLSRNQSLIKKNIELIDLKPADVLIERFVAWKVIVKQLTSYFEGIADIENNTARELTKLAGVIQVPFKAGNQFLGEGGLQDVYYNIRDKTRVIADQHADLGRTVDSSIVQHLQKLRAEIKAHIKNVQIDTGKLAASVAKERELSTKLVGELANSISTFKNTPMNLIPKHDPYIANQAVARQLHRQVLEENLLQKSIVMMQQNSAHFEEGIVRSIQSAWQTFDEWQSRASLASQEIFRSLTTHMASLAPDREWIQFSARSDHLLDPDTPLRDPSAINYPLKDDSSVVPVHVGHLERKKRFTRTYAESYFVLTPSGFLHEFPSSDPALSHTPSFSLFLPSCTLGPPSSTTARAHKFHLEGTKDGSGTTKAKSGSWKGLIPGQGGDSKAWSFRARSRDEMMEWWNDIRMLCARYLIASEMVDRTGPVEAAVKSAGYNSEDYEEEEGEDEDEEEGNAQTADEGDGSSVEEEADHPAYESDPAPPGYSHPEKHGGVEIGANGYAIEKKPHLPGHYPSETQQHLDEAAVNTHNNEGRHAPQDTHVAHPLVRQPTGPTVDPGEDPLPASRHGSTHRGSNVRRRLSKRQMEKAPAVGSDTGSLNGVPAPATALVDSDDEDHAVVIPRRKSRTPSPRIPTYVPSSPIPKQRTSVREATPPPAANLHAHDYAAEHLTDGEGAAGADAGVAPEDDEDDEDIYTDDEREGGPRGAHDLGAGATAAAVPPHAPGTGVDESPNARGGIIGSVATSIGNVVRGATGRV